MAVVLRRDGVVSTGHLDVAISVDLPLAFQEVREAFGWKREERRPLRLLELLLHLLLGCPVDAEVGDLGFPLPEPLVVRLEALKLLSSKPVVLGVAHSAFDL